jgi:fatty-acyl-CoA synthase
MDAMLSTMQDRQITVQSIFLHGAAIFADSRVAVFDGVWVCHTTYQRVAERVRCLAAALWRLGIAAGDRVGSFCRNTPEHVEAYFAVPSMGAVLHT